MQNAIPDIYLGEDGNLNLFLQTLAGVQESVFLSNQVVSEDMFIKTANEAALEAYGDQYGRPRLQGTPSSGELLFTGDGGTPIPIETQVAYDPGTGEDPLYFNTTETGTIPNPGTPTAPTTAVSGSAGVLPAGTYEYAVTFVTDAGETEAGAESEPLVKGNTNQITVSNIPLGGLGTIARKLYRRVDGGEWHYTGGAIEAALADNTTTSISDNATGLLQIDPPEVSTAEKLTLAAESEDNGEIYNVLPGTITVLSDTPDGITLVTNEAAFSGGSDREAVEDFRQNLLERVKAPGTGGPEDIKTLAEAVEGVESATVFENDNEGTPTNGHVTVRISGPDGSVPTAQALADTLEALEAADFANVTFHVASFTAVPTDVDVGVTLEDGFILADVDDSVQAAISDHINNLEVGETLTVAGLISAVFGLPGTTDVQITDPVANQVTGATSKRTPGTITVVEI